MIVTVNSVLWEAVAHDYSFLLCYTLAIGSYREGDIRLVGGLHNWEGRVELFWEGEWGAISDSQWTDTDARIVCRQLQHASESGNNY